MIEEALAANTAALNRNSDLLERVIAGQEAAMEKLAGGASTPRKTRASKVADAADAAGNASDASADTGSTAEGAASVSEQQPETVTVASIVAGIGGDSEKLKAHISGWTGGTEDEAERKNRVGLLKSMAEQFGVKPSFADLVPHAAKAVFFVERARALGLDAVDVKASYDFDGDPTQEAPAAASDFG